ncbi:MULTISPECIES: ribosome assembly RNA-binding protein YhbY [Aerococcus]|uniref:Ribosome assembly RNA-binding protein YhbY n=1 Tax=Aerococcus sanguinicola TaxID=119206 RepID=A0A5N1GIQ9_9LACT|nr:MULTISPECIES: ribosome assembly RNA-binding protein YhbY [Aerococcus]KAA9300857.1 ribosome assembly RNA-binding protein YhbY [Aerococcus sanguinicola]MDK6369087.1 ribosome assembly RNA-binding protein YhbY [Aerococcus sp. UMB9870]MDK6679854.1 ribosome assembly RNA-binding protein YhbY [Aerococcus sp. UMB8608]MDK6686580.1 ribosome assembly RNA-binding protein YhbY [Aerococcus sp. UMB8623]MDK6939776.1 ribosome assembly RNA-binding protein YhbY [Aerococcus sp. UMB8487]
MLNNKEKKYLKKIAQKEKAIFQIGKNGLTDELIKQVDQALEKRELVKLNILQNSSAEVDEAARELAAGLRADIVQTIGKTLVLYRPSQEGKNQKVSADLKALK